MSTQDLHRVHRHYVRTSGIFKAAWTYHQFLSGLCQVFPELAAPEVPADLHHLYSELKGVSQNLSETAAEAAEAQLRQLESELAPVTATLLAADDEISAGQLRSFFQRVKSFDDNILAHLVKFYLYSRDDGAWVPDRLDKADFLVTKLAEEYDESSHGFAIGDPTRVRENAEGFWAALGAPPIDEGSIEALEAELRALGQELQAVDSIDELHERGLIAGYRERKHSLGDAFFQPRVLSAILEANLVLKNQVRELYQREEQTIVAEYQQVFELERDAPVDTELGAELSEFRLAVDRFEGQLQGKNLRLDELAELRHRVRDLLPRLRPPSELDDTAFVVPREARDEAAAAAPGPLQPVADEYVEEQYDAILGALDDTNPTLEARQVALQPEIFGFGITPREVIAYRRLFGGAECDRELEEFLLRGAALRARVEQEVDEIKDILDDAAVTREAPQYERARSTVRRADLYLRRFNHRLEMEILDGDPEEARALQVLKMRLMRAYSGLWLMVYRD